MGSVSSVRRLDPQIREEVNRLLDQGMTLDCIIARLRAMGVETVSRSALGRYKQRFEKIVEKVRRSREIADALVRNFGGETEDKAMRANIEMMHGIVSDMLMQIGDEDEEGPAGGVTLDPKDAMNLAKALDHLSRARKTDQDAILKVREEAARAATAKAAEAVRSVGKKAGMSRDLKQQILEAMGVQEN